MKKSLCSWVLCANYHSQMAAHFAALNMFMLASCASGLLTHPSVRIPTLGAHRSVHLIVCSAAPASGLSTFSSSRVTLNGVQHYIRDTGDPGPSSGPIAVLLHGFTGNTDSWQDVAPILFQGGVRAIAIDRVGIFMFFSVNTCI